MLIALSNSLTFRVCGRNNTVVRALIKSSLVWFSAFAAGCFVVPFCKMRACTTKQTVGIALMFKNVGHK